MELDANWVCDIDSREVFITYFFYLYIGLWIIFWIFGNKKDKSE